MSNRCTLARGKLDDFLAWAFLQGYTLVQTKGEWEKARLDGPDGIAIVHDRSRGAHYSIHGLSERLVYRWLNERSRNDD